MISLFRRSLACSQFWPYIRCFASSRLPELFQKPSCLPICPKLPASILTSWLKLLFFSKQVLLLVPKSCLKACVFVRRAHTTSIEQFSPIFWLVLLCPREWLPSWHRKAISALWDIWLIASIDLLSQKWNKPSLHAPSSAGPIIPQLISSFSARIHKSIWAPATQFCKLPSQSIFQFPPAKLFPFLLAQPPPSLFPDRAYWVLQSFHAALWV